MVLAGNPQTEISLFAGLLVTKPAPEIVICFPPTNDVEVEVAVGSAGKLTDTVEGVTEAKP